jgi:deoxyribose-phosphate aldolase
VEEKGEKNRGTASYQQETQQICRSEEDIMSEILVTSAPSSSPVDVREYLDSTYLKTAEQAGLSEEENETVACKFIQEAIDNNFKLIMIRPWMVSTARQMIDAASAGVTVGTVIDFPLGSGGISVKLQEATAAVANGADDLDFVIDYALYKSGEEEGVKAEVLQCTQYGLSKKKIVKWIIESAALEEEQITAVSALIRDIVIANFPERDHRNVYIKSSTGFFKTVDNKPNGATVASIKLMMQSAGPLSVKASGGVKTSEEAVIMIELGVKRIGTSAALNIYSGSNNVATSASAGASSGGVGSSSEIAADEY